MTMKKKILLVDDESGLLKVTLLRLNHSGYEAFGAADGQEGLDLVRQKMPDLIILDKVMPKMNGDEVARIVKKDEKLKKIPIILISAEVENMEQRASECGADSYLPKPFDAKELLGMIEKLLSARRSDEATNFHLKF